jgi:hypothetical protein
MASPKLALKGGAVLRAPLFFCTPITVGCYE